MGEKIVSNVAELRKAAGLTQKELADTVGTTVITVQNWESGRTGLDQLLRVARLCKALGCTAEQLITVETQPNE
jgi:transcriptional regulator with XRE-family HTH domain